MRAPSASRTPSLFPELLDIGAGEVGWTPPREGRGVSAATGEVVLSGLTVTSIGGEEIGAPSASVGAAGVVRMPVKLARLGFETDIGIDGDGPGDAIATRVRAHVELKAIACDVLAAHSEDRLTGRPYTIVFGFDLHDADYVSSQVHLDPWVHSPGILDRVLSMTRVRKGVINLLQAVLRAGPGLDRLQARLNGELLERHGSPDGAIDALSLAAEDPPRIGVRPVERLAALLYPGEAFEACGPPVFASGRAGWNAVHTHSLRGKSASGAPGVERAISVGFRVEGDGRVVTRVLPSG